MIYSDVSCDVKNTLKNMEKYQVSKMVDMDLLGLITVTGKKEIIFDGILNYNNIDIEYIKNKLRKSAIDLHEHEDASTLSIDDVEYLIVPVREYGHYKVFCVCCKIGRVFSEKDLTIMEFVVSATYKSVLLDNEFVKEQNFLQNIFNSVASFIVSIDSNDKVISVNKNALDRFAKNDDTMIGKDYKQYISDADIKKISGAIKYVMENKKTYYFVEEVFSNIKKGRLFTNLTISPLIEYKGEVTGVVIVGSDKTKQRIYEMEIEQLKQFSLLGELATGLAHDIKNPLTSIRGCSRILEKKLADNEECMEFVTPIVKQVDRINEVMDQMLSYSFITQKDNYSMIDINEVLEKCINVIMFHTKSKSINIEKRLSEDLPLIKANNVQLQQAFINIMFNAIQAIESEGNILIESRKVEKGNKILVAITDDGKGIDERDKKRIFDPLYTTKTGGNGIGLSIAKRAFDKSNGEIIVSSKVDIGTEFKVYFSF